METLSMTSVSLPIQLVGQILEEWLNANRFSVVHRVTGVDVIDAYDREAGVVHVDLALEMPAATAAPAQDVRAGKSVEETALALGHAHLVEVGTNGRNGHGAPLPRRVVVERAATKNNAGTDKAGRPLATEEQKRRIWELREHTAREIAEELGLNHKTVANYLTKYRKESAQAGGDDNNRLPSPPARRSHQSCAARRVGKRLEPNHSDQALTPQITRLAPPHTLTPSGHETAPAPVRPSAPPPACC